MLQPQDYLTIYQGDNIPHLSIALGEKLLFETDRAAARGELKNPEL
jgi:hypothetical protein